MRTQATRWVYRSDFYDCTMCINRNIETAFEEWNAYAFKKFFGFTPRKNKWTEFIILQGN